MNLKDAKSQFFRSVPYKVLKGWGYELIIINNDKYCGKILHLNENGRTSMHYHLLKEKETFFVLSGKVALYFIDTFTSEENCIILEKNNSFTVEKGLPHRFVGLVESDVLEISMPDREDDSYRVYPGDSQREK